jgi:hypothetical protein
MDIRIQAINEEHYLSSIKRSAVVIDVLAVLLLLILFSSHFVQRFAAL